MILSASGWRGIFARDGNEESSDCAVAAECLDMVFGAATVFARFLKKSSGGAGKPVVLLGTDTRPTGPEAVRVARAALENEGCETRVIGITAAPEIMAYSRTLGAELRGERPGGFIFISASHNPIGHNGLKFGLPDGGVLPPGDAEKLIADFRSGSWRAHKVPFATEGEAGLKRRSLDAYRAFAGEVIAGDGISAAELKDLLRNALSERPLGVVCDFNGSARAASIDRDFFADYGIRFFAINDTPGKIAHRIVPEGDALEPCRRLLEDRHRIDPAFVLGYVPDCDGDRGNLVIWDDASGKCRVPDAQEVFALACLAELCHLRMSARAEGSVVAVNDATSMRIDRLAASFGAEVRRAEVGEANVVSLARKLREAGKTVRILGEGAAGGNIIHPQAVRDPLCTIMGMVKLLRLRNFFRPGELPSPGELSASLPAFVTTSTYENSALLHIRSSDHAALKREYQKIFCARWPEIRKKFLAGRGLNEARAFRYNGTEEVPCDDDYGAAGRGGLKINFCDESGLARAALWMRGSATEPVFRVMADVEGNDAALERALISLQRDMAGDADLRIAG